MERGTLVFVHLPEATKIDMKITVSTVEDLIGLMDDWDPSTGNAILHAKMKFPNSFEALDSAIAEIMSTKLPGSSDLFFTITMFVHFSKTPPRVPKMESVRKVKRGYTGAIHVYKNDLFCASGELPAETIKSAIMMRLKQQVELLLNRSEMK